MKRFFALWLCCLPVLTHAADREWRFRVWLDDREIGRHRFSLSEEDGLQRVLSEADFEYRLLFVKLYEYRHRDEEIWRESCLASIESSTDANGKDYRVEGALQPGGFVVSGSGGETRLPECVMSFAYWNPEFLQQERLLNSQNGKWLDVTVSDPVPDELEVRGALREASRYRLEAGELCIDLWYSPQGDWLALETRTDGGRVLRYELL